jgi:hypothetical protein
MDRTRGPRDWLLDAPRGSGRNLDAYARADLGRAFLGRLTYQLEFQYDNSFGQNII